MSVKNLGMLAALAAIIFLASLALARPAGAQSNDCAAAPVDLQPGTESCAAGDVSAAPVLALTGPSATTLLVVFGVLLLALGWATTVVGAQSEAVISGERPRPQRSAPTSTGSTCGQPRSPQPRAR